MAPPKPSDNEDLKEKKSPTANAESHDEISVFRMFRYADGLDYVLLVLGIVLAFALGALIPLQSIVFGSLTDGLIEGQAKWVNNTFDFESFQSQTVDAIMNYVYLGIGSLLLGYIVMACWYTSCERQIHRIRQRFFAAILRQNVAWLDQNPAGALTTKMSDGIDRMKEGMGDKIGILCQSIATFICGITIAFTNSWKMTLVMMAIVPFIAFSLFLSVKLLGSATRKEIAEYGKAGAIADEVFTAIRTVMAFNGQQYEIDRYEKRLAGAKKMGIRKAAFNGALIAIQFLLIFIAMGIGFWYAATLVSNGEMSPGTTFTVFWSVMIGAFAIGQASPQIGIIIGAKTAAASIFAIIDRTPEIDCQSVEGKTIAKPEGRISFQSVHFRYPSRPEIPILNGVSYTVEPGQTVALVGHSGCGKSTMISLLLRYYDAESGLVTIDGVRVSEMNINWLRNTVGVVSQEPILFDTTIEKNLKMGNADLTEEDMIRVCTMANAHDFVMKLPKNINFGDMRNSNLTKLNEWSVLVGIMCQYLHGPLGNRCVSSASFIFSPLGYQTLVGDGGVQLSGGQKQRIAIARALSRNPRILLLDEATSALDAESEGIVQEALEKASKGRTTLTIAHRLATIRNADRILVFDHGNIVESGTHDELMTKNGHYYDLVQAQAIHDTGESHLDAIQEELDDEVTVGSNMRNRGTSTGVSLADSQRRRSKNRMSNRINRSMTRQTSALEREEERMKEELEDEGVSEASLLDILKFARKEWLFLFIAFFFSFIRGLMWPAFSLIYGQIFKTLSSPDVMEGAVTNAFLFVGLGLVTGAATFLAGWIFGAAGEKLTMRLRLAVMRNLLRHDAAYFDHPSHSSGKLTTRLATDAPNVKSAIDHRLADLLQGIVSLVAGVAVAFFYDWRMAPIGILTAVVLVLLQAAVAQYLKRRGSRDVPLAENASRLAVEAIGNVRTVQYLTKEKHFYDMFEEGMAGSHRTAIVKGLWQALAYGMSASFMFFNFASAYRFGVWLVENRWTSPYAVFQVIEALNLSSMGVMTAAAYFPEYVKARLAAGLMFGMIRQEPNFDNLSEAGVKKELTGNIAVNGVYFSYPTRRQHLVVRNLTVKADVGKTIALVGPSGCGKSTVIQLLERFYDPMDGRVTIDDIDVRTMNIRHLRSQIALVSQEPTLFDASIRDNITYGLGEISQQKIEEAAKLANIHTFVSELPDGYNTNVGAKGTQLSGGQKQRIAIARAIVRNPKILLLDEATSALDTASEQIVQEALDKAREGRTCITIAHRLSTIQNADVIVVVRNGAVAEQGTHSQLLTRKGLYYRLIQKQDLK